AGRRIGHAALRRLRARAGALAAACETAGRRHRTGIDTVRGIHLHPRTAAGCRAGSFAGRGARSRHRGSPRTRGSRFDRLKHTDVMNYQRDRTLLEATTSMAPSDVLKAAKEFFSRRPSIYTAF